MTYRINNTGKILIGTVVATAAAEAITGEDLGLRRGCLTGLIVWMCWVALILTSVYWLIFK